MGHLCQLSYLHGEVCRASFSIAVVSESEAFFSRLLRVKAISPEPGVGGSSPAEVTRERVISSLVPKPLGPSLLWLPEVKQAIGFQTRPWLQ